MAASNRSPRFPFIPLKTAIQRASELYEKEKRHGVNASIAVTHWGYKETSSGGKQTIAALKAYGLIEDSGKSDSRTIKVSDLALRILLDSREQSEERSQALKSAALKPKIFNELWAKYSEEGLPSDESINHFLIFQKNVNENSAGDLTKNFKSTIQFSGLNESDRILDEDDNEDEAGGDNSAENTPPPPGRNENPPGALTLRRQPGMTQATFPLDEGQATFQWPETLSQESYEDLIAWIELLKNRAKRSVKRPLEDNSDLIE